MITAADTIAAAVGRLRAAGFAVCRIDPGEKQPTYKGWPTYSREADDFRPEDGVGIIAGPLSNANRPGHALVIVDLDSPDSVELADDFLPATGVSEGRPGKPRSHRYYLVPFSTIPDWAKSTAEQAAPAAIKQRGHPGPFKKGFDHLVTKKRVIDFLGTGGQAVCPPSNWTSADGTRTALREWDGGEPGEPGVSDFEDLWSSVVQLAVACGAKLPDVGPKPPDAEVNGQAKADPFVQNTGSGASVIDRARAYLARIPGAVAGQGGHDATFAAARALVWGFELSKDQALRLLIDEYNPRCVPPWSEAELRHKVADADRLPFDKPRGWLRDEARVGQEGGGAQPSDNGYTKPETPGEGDQVPPPPPPGGTHETPADGGEVPPPPNDPAAGGGSTPRFKFIDSAAFAGGDYRPEWHVRHILVKHQPGVIAAGSKMLKTTIAADLAVSIASGADFLGTFGVARRARVATVSGESGAHTLQETARRICQAKGVKLADLGDRLQWCFSLPTFSDLGVMTEFADELVKHNAEVVVIDPVYLALGAIDARNLFEAGAAFRVVADVLLKAGCTPILVHHANRQLQTGEPMELQNLAYSGLEQFARQWLLLNRREKYVGDGVHDLWLSIGGSAGHGGLWSLHVEEGTLDQCFGGRRWDVTVQTPNEVRTDQFDRREEDRREKARKKMVAEEAAVLLAIDAEVTIHPAATKTRIKERTGYGSQKVRETLESLIESGVIEEVEFDKVTGNGAASKLTGYRRVNK